MASELESTVLQVWHLLDGPAHELDGRMDVAAAREQPDTVALLFLTRGPLPHEPTWHLFFQAALQLSPGVHTICSSGGRKCLVKFEFWFCQA